MAENSETKMMGAFAAGLVVLAITSVIGIVVLDEFKNSLPIKNVTTDQRNDTIELFIAGIAVFGTFATILALILIAKVILGLVKKGLQ